MIYRDSIGIPTKKRVVQVIGFPKTPKKHPFRWSQVLGATGFAERSLENSYGAYPCLGG